jgi:hypothetical protein
VSAYVIRIRPAANEPSRFRWAIYEGRALRPATQSEESYPSEETARSAAEQVLSAMDARP